MSAGLSSYDREIALYTKALALGNRRERALTEAMGAMLAADTAAAGRFARSIVSLLHPEQKSPPAKLYCEPEAWFSRGRIRISNRSADLFLWSPAGNYVLFVEGKLNAPTGRKQVADYINAPPPRWFPEAVDRNATVHVALIANKALVPRDRTKSNRWPGAITWIALLDELEKLDFAEHERAHRWRNLLRHYDGIGAFRTAEVGTQDLVHTLNAVALSAVRDIDRALQRRGGRARPLSWNFNTEAVVRKTKGGAAMRLTVKPAARRRAQELEVRLRDDGGQSPRVYVEARERTAERGRIILTGPEADEVRHGIKAAVLADHR